MKTLNYIAGEWQPAGQGRAFEVRNPADESLVAQVPDSGADDAQRAADAASEALPAWKARPARDRALVLKKWLALIESRTEELAQLISREQGKPLAEGRGEVAYSAGYVEWFAEEAVRAYGENVPAPCEETFGPVVPVFRFASEEEVLRLANDTPFGLAGYFYSNDVRPIWRVAAALETGLVGINEGAISAQAAPFGGVKESGYGREGSHWGLEEYMHTKYLCQGNLS